MNFAKKTLLLLLIVMLLNTSNAFAQEEPPPLAGYMVQTGDTLYSIAVEFGVSVDDIIRVNNITNPNAISIGTVLLIPGLDWLTGTIQSKQIKLGEGIRNLSRIFNVSTEIFARLNGISSPNQLYYGFSAVVTQQELGLNNAGRAMVTANKTLIEQSIVGNGNPWQTAIDNKLDGLWQNIEGDVVFLTGKLSTPNSPYSFPSEVVNLATSNLSFVQGETSIFSVVLDQGAFSGALFGYQFDFYQSNGSTYYGLQGIPAKLIPGRHEVIFEYVTESGDKKAHSQYINVLSGGYIYEALTVPNDYLSDDTSELESQAIAAFVTDKTPEKQWHGVLFAPTPFPDSITSTFGNRRSYNGGPYDFYHSGVDFGGGLGVQIFAVANGMVVFAETTDVRGNAVIIDHGWGVYSGYWHQSEILVEVGQIVEEGQVIGLVGNTGRSNGAHLHWELWVNEVSVNPLSWLYNAYP